MRYVIYARFSSVGQNPMSCEQQTTAFRQWAARQGGWEEIAEPYTDHGISGYRKQREGRAGLDGLITLAESGALRGGCIGLWSTSRLSRQFSFIVPELLRLHDKHGVLVADTKFGLIDVGTPMGRIVLTMAANMDQEYSAEISRSSKRGLLSQAVAGYWPTGRVPYGTKAVKTDGGRILVPNDQTPSLLEVFRLRQQMASHAVAQTLAVMGVEPPGGAATWRNSSVIYMIKNPAYIGKIPFGGQLYEAKFPPIVPPDLWASVQYEGAARRCHGPSEQKYKGIAFCGGCGAAAWRKKETRGYTRIKCRTTFQGVECRDPGSVIEADLDQAIWSLLDTMLGGPQADLMVRLASVRKGDDEARAAAELNQAVEVEERLASAVATVPDSGPLLVKLSEAVEVRRAARAKLGAIRDSAAGAGAVSRLRSEIARREGKTLRELVSAVKIFGRREVFLDVTLAFTKSRQPIRLHLPQV